METSNKSQTTTRNAQTKPNVEKAAKVFLNDGKRLASELYEDSMNRMSEAEEQIKEYTDEVLKHVQRNPLASVLIAGGIGVLLSMLFRK